MAERLKLFGFGIREILALKGDLRSVGADTGLFAGSRRSHFTRDSCVECLDVALVVGTSESCGCSEVVAPLPDRDAVGMAERIDHLSFGDGFSANTANLIAGVATLCTGCCLCIFRNGRCMFAARQTIGIRQTEIIQIERRGQFAVVHYCTVVQ